MTNLPKIYQENPLSLDKSLFDKHTTFDERKSLQVDIKIASATTSWMLADFYKYLYDELGNSKTPKILGQLAKTYGERPSTVRNYTRTAQAFSPSERNPMASFSHHFQSWQIDKYDEKTHSFLSNERFDWLQKAIDNFWSTRRLYEEIEQ